MSENHKKPISVWSLASGSKANCTLISSAATSILIDFGVSCRCASKTLASLGLSLSSLDGVFITHEHSDHISGLCTFFKSYDVPVHMTEPSHLAYIRGRGFEYRDKITVHPPVYQVTVGDLTVTSLPVPHDASECVAYRISDDSGNAVGICTDTGEPSDALLDFFTGCETVITECNHDVIMLRCGIYPEDLKYRILSGVGHTSNDACASFSVELARRGVKNIILAHISPENNTPELALHTVRTALTNAGCSVETLVCAPRDSLLRLI